MVDVFGGSGGSVLAKTGPRGPKGAKGAEGPRGPRGFDSSLHDLCMWLPNSVLKSLRGTDEIGSFFISKLTRDLTIQNDVVTVWKSESITGVNLTAEEGTKDVTKIKSGSYALGFKRNRYISDTLHVLSTHKGTSSFLCITFKAVGAGEQVLISNHSDDMEDEDDYCEIRVSPTEIILHLHSEDEIIQRSSKEWTTLFVACNSDHTTSHFKYNVNGVTGSYTRPVGEDNVVGIAVGSRYNGEMYLNGHVLSMELYDANQPIEVPEELKNMVMKSQRRRSIII